MCVDNPLRDFTLGTNIHNKMCLPIWSTRSAICWLRQSQSMKRLKQQFVFLYEHCSLSRNSPVSRSLASPPPSPNPYCSHVSPSNCPFVWHYSFRDKSMTTAASQEQECFCVLWRAAVLLAGARAGAVQAVPVTGALPATSWTSLVQQWCSVAPAA